MFLCQFSGFPKVARNFNYIRKNKLFGKLLIVNMIHDEQLMEINVKELNAQRIVTDVCKNMQFKLEGFPPLFVGAGIGAAWGVAKGKMAILKMSAAVLCVIIPSAT